MRKKLSPIQIFHLALMVLLFAFSIYSFFVLLGLAAGASGTDSLLYTLYGAYQATNAIAICCGVLYLLKGYGKGASRYYKAFLLLVLAGTIVGTVTLALAAGELGNALPSIIMLTGKTIALIVLAFGNDLGKRNTWIAFGIIVALDVLLVFSLSNNALPAQRIIGALSRLVLDGTIGLAIRGKYADKDARGTK